MTRSDPQLARPSRGHALPTNAELFERYAALVFRRCREILKHDDAARDAVHEVFIKIFEGRERFRADAAPATWLYATATLHCLQRLRNQLRHGDKLLELGHVLRASGDPSHVRPDERVLIRELLAHVDEETTAMVYLRVMDELPLEEVAELVGRSRKTVADRVREFLQCARVQLAEPGDV